mmetsp:Transcript_20129/g.43807  ORF Transcript_20129/g.43807 Transcript_20129/m.43807 type:complete len:252 (-) Transcript_20129:577-1332(-)
MFLWDVTMARCCFVLLQQCVHVAPFVNKGIPHNPEILQSLFPGRLEFSVLFYLALLAQPVSEILAIFFVPEGDLTMAFSFFILLQQCVGTIPIAFGTPNDSEVLQSLFFFGGEFSELLGLALVVQPHSKIYAIFCFVSKGCVTIAFSLLVPQQDREHLLPLLALDVPHDTELGQSILHVRIEPSPVCLALALVVQPHPETFPVFLVFLRNVAIAFSFFVLQEKRVHVLPLPSLNIPHDSNFGQPVFQIWIE